MEYWGSEVVKYESMDFCLSSMGASSHHLPSIQPVNLYFDGAKAGLHYSNTPLLHRSFAPSLVRFSLLPLVDRRVWPRIRSQIIRTWANQFVVGTLLFDMRRPPGNPRQRAAQRADSARDA
jgi:hypothetical protein